MGLVPVLLYLVGGLVAGIGFLTSLIPIPVLF